MQGWCGDQYYKCRVPIDSTDWSLAQAKVREIETAVILPQPLPEPERVTVTDAIARYVSECKARNLSDATISKYRVLLEKRLTPFAERKAIRFVDEFTIELLREFRHSWKDAPLAASKKGERLRAFFRFSHDSGYIKLNPAIHLRPPKVKPNEKQPFEKEEMEKILWACDVYDTRGAYGEGNRHRLRAFVLVLRYTGLRIRDVVTLKRSAVKDGKIFVRTQKAGTQVLVPVPPAVTEALNQVPVVNPDYFFWSGSGLPKSSVANWQRSLRKLFELAGVEKGHAHRMRVTMAVELLKRGVSVENVAAILGNTPLIVQKHYAPFVQARQLILEKQVMATW
jgi:integrase/recombinase XerD